LLAGVHAYFLAEFFVVACAETTNRGAVDALELASGIVKVKDVVGRILLVSPHTVSAFYNVNAIVFTIKKCVNITHSLRLWPVSRDSCSLRERLAVVKQYL
jgi:hypothetical protein